MQVCTHIGTHDHHVACGDCTELHMLRDQLLQKTIGRTLKASLSSIAMSTSLEFLEDQHIGKDGDKPLLISDIKMQETMWKFDRFTGPILHQNVWKFKRMDKNNIIDTVFERCVGHLCRRTNFQA